jgi:NADH dehydrogenase (ubiquinone) 1 alpha subcomplex subunit 6
MASSASKVVRFGARQVRPILSADGLEARRRVLNLYKAWYRQIPSIMLNYDIPLLEKDCKATLRSMFLKNKYVTDLRAIDLLLLRVKWSLLKR